MKKQKPKFTISINSRSSVKWSRAGRTYTKKNIHVGNTAGLVRRRHDPSDKKASNIANIFILGPIDPPTFQNDAANLYFKDELPNIPQYPIAEELTNGGILFSEGSNDELNYQILFQFSQHFEALKKEVFTKLTINESIQNTMQSAILSLVNNARVNNINVSARSPPNDEYEFNFPFRIMFAYLGFIGGCDLTVAVFDILKEVLAFELAFCFNYTGVRGKQHFSLVNINDVIFDCVRSNPRTSNETGTSVRNKIMIWVQQSEDKLTKVQKAGINASVNYDTEEDP